MWDIYVIGDAAYTTQILNAVASIFGSGNIGTLAGVGFLVGLLFSIGRGIMTGGRDVNPSGVILGLVIYLAMFAPTVDVRVNSTVTGSVRVVANVPFGPAAIGSLLSRLGYGVTNLMEQAFAVPAMTDYGYVSPIQTASLVKKAAADGIIIESMKSDNHRLYKSLVNYVSQCTMVGIKMGTIDPQTIKDSQNPLDEIRFDSTIYKTRQFRDNGTTADVPCTGAYNEVRARVVNSWGGTNPARLLAPALLRDIESQTPGGSTAASQNKLNELAASLTNAAVGAQQLGLNMLLHEVMKAGELEFFDEHADVSKLAAMEQMRAQRNAAWQLEQDNFASVMLPLISFFENFVFAISPLMVFIVFLGNSGIGLLGKYMFLTLWVQMWMPLMAIVNLFVMMTATGSMDLVSIGPAEMGSFTSITYMGNEVNTWLGVAGKLLASIPAISLMLLYGTSQAATQIARGFEGGGSAASSSKVMAPDMTSVGAGHSASPLMQGSAVTGTHKTGAKALGWSVGNTNGWNEMASSSQKEMLGAKDEYSKALSSAYGFSMGARKSSSEGASAGTGYQFSESKLDQMAKQVTNDIAEKHGWKQGSQEYSQLSSQVSAQMGASVAGKSGTSGKGQKNAKGGSAAGGSGNIGGGWAGSDLEASRRGTEVSNEVSDALAKRFGSTEQMSQAVADSASADLKKGRDNFLTAGLDKSQKEALQKANSAYASQAEEYANVQSLSSGGSVASNKDGVDVAQRMGQAGMGQDVEQALQQHGLKGEAFRNAMAQSGAMGLSGEQQKLHAGMGLLMGHYDSGLSGDAKVSAMETGAGLLNQAFGTGHNTGSDHDRNENISGKEHPKEDMGNLRAPIDSKTRELEGAVTDGIQRTGEGMVPLSTSPSNLNSDAEAEIAMRASEQGDSYSGNERSVQKQSAEAAFNRGEAMLANRYSGGDAWQDGGLYSAMKDEAGEFGRGDVNSGFGEGAGMAESGPGMSSYSAQRANDIEAMGAEETARNVFGDDANSAIRQVNDMEQTTGSEFSGAQKYAMIVSAMADDGKFHNSSFEDKREMVAAGEIAAEEYRSVGGSDAGGYMQAIGEVTKNYGSGHIDDKDAPEMMSMFSSVKDLSEVDNPTKQQ